MKRVRLHIAVEVTISDPMPALIAEGINRPYAELSVVRSLVARLQEEANRTPSAIGAEVRLDDVDHVP
jgi:hypothetical protein